MSNSERKMNFLESILFNVGSALVDKYWPTIKAAGKEELDERIKDIEGMFDEKTKQLMSAVLLTLANGLESFAANGIDKITDAIPGDIDDKLFDGLPGEIADFLKGLINPK